MFGHQHPEVLCRPHGAGPGRRAGPASAATTYASCSGAGYDISASVTGADDCQISSATQDKMADPDALTVNEDSGFFGIDSWEIWGELDENGMLDGDAVSFGKTGSFDLSAYFEGMVGEVMLVFKSGAGTSLVGFLFNLDADGMTTLAGDWTTPFTCPAFHWNTINPANQCKNFPKSVGHISVYANVTPAPVPLPAAGILLLGGPWRPGGAAARQARQQDRLSLVPVRAQKGQSFGAALDRFRPVLPPRPSRRRRLLLFRPGNRTPLAR